MRKEEFNSGEITSSKDVNRFHFLDSVRGIAAILVLLQHTCGIFFPLITKELTYSTLALGQMGVVAFFLVSGFIIPFSLEHSKSIMNFIVGRIFRIYPLYLLVICIQIGMTYLPLQDGITNFSIVKVLATHLIFIQEYFPFSSSWSVNFVLGSWTLFIEAIWYFLVVSLFYFRISHYRFMTITLALFATLILASLMVDIRFPFGRMAMLYNCILGLHMYRWKTCSISDKTFMNLLFPSVVIISISLWMAYAHFKSDHFTFPCILFSWASAYAIFGLYFVFQKNKHGFFPGILSFLGTISYSVYLTHFTILTLLLHFFGNSILTFCLVLFSTICFSSCTFYWIEKPGIRFGKSLVNRK